MKIKRYFAPDMRQAIRKVREEQGPDAVILSNRRVNGGIEIIAALDYDESMLGGSGPADAAAAPAPGADSNVADLAAAREQAAAPRPARTASKTAEWSEDPAIAAMREELRSLRGLLENQLSQLAWGEQARRSPLQAGVLQRFSDMGLTSDLARELADGVGEAQDLDHAWRQALGLLAHRVRITDDDILSDGGVVSLVGATGVGKTTMVAKLAARYALRHGKRHVALVSTDNFRIGGQEQLQIYGQLLGIPVYWATDSDSLRRVLSELQDKRLVLIDTAGMSQRDMRLAEQLATLRAGGPSIRSYVVLSATTQATTQLEVAQAFRRSPLAGCILTKVDETASLGGALSAAVRCDLPVAYVGDGQRVPEDLHPARAHNLVSRAVALMQQSAGYAGQTNGERSEHSGVTHAHV